MSGAIRNLTKMISDNYIAPLTELSIHILSHTVGCYLNKLKNYLFHFLVKSECQGDIIVSHGSDPMCIGLETKNLYSVWHPA